MKKLPRKTITRVLLYIRTLEGLLKEKRYLVSSRQLSEITGLSDVKIRKDISNFKSVGKPRVGYKTADLKKTLENYCCRITRFIWCFWGREFGVRDT